MSDIMNELGAISPLLPPLVRALLVLLVGIVCWFFASIPLAVIYTALRSGLRSLAERLRDTAGGLRGAAARALHAASQIKAQAVADMRIRYVYTESEGRLQTRLIQIKAATHALESTLERVTSKITLQMNSLAAQMHALAPPSNETIAALSDGRQDTLREAITARRSASIALFIVIPLILFLITVNTFMLMKFFESFFDEYVNYKWGLKVAPVLGLLFSAVEVAFGFIHFYMGKRQGGGAGKAVTQTFILFLIGCLAALEFFLYLLMSAEISRLLTSSGLQLPPVITQYAQIALGPFGFVMVCGLAFTGFILFDAWNNFSDAGVLADLKKTYRDHIQAQRNAGNMYDAIKVQANAARKSLEDLHSDAGSIVPSASAVRQSATELRDAVQQVAALRRNPVSEQTHADAAGFFDTQTFIGIAFLVAIWAFCWLQYQFIGDPQSTLRLHPVLALVLAGVEAAAIVVASYKAYAPVSIVTDHRGTEAVRLSDEKLVTAACCLVIALALIFNVFLTYSESGWIWMLWGTLGCLIVMALVLFGRTLPSITHALRLLGQQAVLAIASVLAAAGALLLWVSSLVTRAVSYALFCLAYPFLYLFWRAKLLAPATVESAQ